MARAACLLLAAAGIGDARMPARMLPTGYVFFLLGASLAMLVLCGIQCKSTFCRTPVRYGGVGSDTIISVADDPDDEGFEMSGSSSMV